MPLVKDGRWADDTWTHLGDEEDVAGTPAGVIVSLARWRESREELLVGNHALGVLLPAGTGGEALAGDFERLALIAVGFPKFRDGRGFTIARELRERWGYRGEIRAIGQVLPDQYPLAARCGFTTVEVAAGTDLAVWAKCLTAMTIAYQPSTQPDEPLSFLRRRVHPAAGGASAARFEK